MIIAPIIAPTTSPTEVEDGDIGVAAPEDEEGTTELVVCMVPAGTDTGTFPTLYSDNVNERHRWRSYMLTSKLEVRRYRQ